VFNWIRSFFKKRDPLPALGFQPRFLEPDTAPAGSVYAVMRNDDKTELEFVVQVLTVYFGFAIKEAVEIALKVHLEGSANIRVMSASEANRVASRIHEHARKRGFPLEITTSPLEYNQVSV